MRHIGKRTPLPQQLDGPWRPLNRWSKCRDKVFLVELIEVTHVQRFCGHTLSSFSSLEGHQKENVLVLRSTPRHILRSQARLPYSTTVPHRKRAFLLALSREHLDTGVCNPSTKSAISS